MKKQKYSFGWIPDYPDVRDYTEAHGKMLSMTAKLKFTKDAPIPFSVDLRKWCSPIENQGDLGSCTAHAVASMVEYFENKTYQKYIDASRLFLYKATRNLMHLSGDTGATLKASLGALVLFGMPPEEFCQYDIQKFDKEPDSFCYAFGQNYKCINYFRHDPTGRTPEDILASIKKYLAAGIPSVFGFTVYDEIQSADKTGKIPFPGTNERFLGGHALFAAGYDDGIAITNQKTGMTTTGAILIQNSWGEEWGMDGFGWLPYKYITEGLACDWWSILKQEWVDTGLFCEEL